MVTLRDLTKSLYEILKELGLFINLLFTSALLCLIINNYMPPNWLNTAIERAVPLDPLAYAIVQSAGFSLAHFISLFALPALCAIVIMRIAAHKEANIAFPRSLRQLGLGWNNLSAYLWVFAAAYLILVPLLVWAGLREEYQRMYPFFFYARYGIGYLSLWWLLYGLYYLGVEFFFRGFLLLGLFPKIGYLAIFVAAIPYVMVHFAKPPSEALGSIFAGILLGYMALRSGSIWGGFLLHWAVGMTMDALSIYFTGGFIAR